MTERSVLLVIEQLGWITEVKTEMPRLYTFGLSGAERCMFSSSLYFFFIVSDGLRQYHPK